MPSKSKGSRPKISRKNTAPRHRKRRPFLKLFFIICIIGLLGGGYLAVQIDARVDQVLRSTGYNKSSAIYSDPLMIFDGTAMKEEVLRTHLRKRQYSESTGAPVNPGEFRFESGELSIINHEFQLPNGAIRKPQTISYNYTTGSIRNVSSPSGKDLVLEPVMIAPLGSGDLKVSSYRKLSELPSFLPKAFIAIEDVRFYDHFGVDPLGILRALIRNIAALKVVQGGSTLTQQLAKNMLFTSRRTIARKVLEAFAAVSLERRLSKDQILEMYLNQVYFGRDSSIAVHGIAEASSTFLGKKVEDINLSEAALLAGLVKAPSAYAPQKHLSRALERRDLVLDSMYDAGFITGTERDAAKRFKIKPLMESTHKRIAAHFVQELESVLDDQFDVEAAIASGVSVYTGLDRDMQACAETALSAGLEKLEKTYPAVKRKSGKELEAALVSIEPYSGLVKAWAGGRDFGLNQFNHVNQAYRQIGSTIKPFVYLTALDRDLNQYKTATTISVLTDEPLKVNLETKDIWEPENYDHEYRGDVTLRYALEHSLNIPAAYIGQRVGIDNVARTGERFRLADRLPRYPSLALGAADTTLLRLTSAYGALANGGVYVAPRLYSSVLSSDSSLTLSQDVFEERVANEAPVYVLTNILQGVVERGTARSIRNLGYTGTAAGKTGTSNDTRDAWFIGFTPNLVTGVWVGFDDNSKVGLTGGAAATPIWAEFMKCSAPYHEDLPFLQPRGVIYRDIDLESHELAVPECPKENLIRELFVEGTEPLERCHYHSGEGPRPRNESSEAAEWRPRGDEFDSDAKGPSLAEEFEREDRERRGESFWGSIFGR